MEVVKSALPDVLVLTLRIFANQRGYFFESYNRREFEAAGVRAAFVQDKAVCSKMQRPIFNVPKQFVYGKLLPSASTSIAGDIFSAAGRGLDAGEKSV